MASRQETHSDPPTSDGSSWTYKRDLCPACTAGPLGEWLQDAPGCWCRVMQGCGLTAATIDRWIAWARGQLRDENTPNTVKRRIRIVALRLATAEGVSNERRQAIDAMLRGDAASPEPAEISMYIKETVTIGVGTVAAPTLLVKPPIRIPHTLFAPTDNTTVCVFGTAEAAPGVNELGLIQLKGGIVMPVGVTITAFNAMVWKQAAADLVRVALFRCINGTATNLSGFLTLGVASVWVPVGALLTEVVSGTDSYVIYVELQNSAVGAQRAKLAHGEIAYSTPDYAKSL